MQHRTGCRSNLIDSIFVQISVGLLLNHPKPQQSMPTALLLVASATFLAAALHRHLHLIAGAGAGAVAVVVALHADPVVLAPGMMVALAIVHRAAARLLAPALDEHLLLDRLHHLHDHRAHVHLRLQVLVHGGVMGDVRRPVEHDRLGLDDQRRMVDADGGRRPAHNQRRLVVHHDLRLALVHGRLDAIGAHFGRAAVAVVVVVVAVAFLHDDGFVAIAVVVVAVVVVVLFDDDRVVVVVVVAIADDVDLLDVVMVMVIAVDDLDVGVVVMVAASGYDLDVLVVMTVAVMVAAVMVVVMMRRTGKLKREVRRNCQW